MFPGFPIKMINLIKCQKDAGDLVVENSNIFNVGIISGTLKCTRCGVKYYIKQGILDLLANQKPLDNICAREVSARDRQAETYDELYYSDLDNEMEIPTVFAHLGNLSGKNIIEFGCGTGRFTVKLLKNANQVIALDFSRQSLFVLAERLIEKINIGLVQADVTQIELACRKFDLALSGQVIEHIPTKLQRSMFFEKVNKCLTPNGIFVCTAYHLDIIRRLRKLPFEGFHSNNVFYHYFTIHELIEEITPHFKILEIHPIKIQLPFARKLRLPIASLSRLLEHIPILNKFGTLVLVKAQRL